ncbi:MAG: DUF1566 domain-containing protein [Bacteroidia bacterium]
MQGIQGATGGVGPFYLGKDTLGGIVYYIYTGSDKLQHGLIVAKTESTGAWQTTNSLTSANRSWDGAYNTNLMTSSPAATYALSFGSGWYLPSINELTLLYNSMYTTNKALSAVGGTQLSITLFYWSSNEFNTSSAYIFYFNGGYSTQNNKPNANNIRAVRTF